MYEGKKVIVVMPAYKAALTLEKTYQEIPHDWVDEVILVDDYSPDNTVEVAKKIGIKHIVQHDKTLAMVEIKNHVTQKRLPWVVTS